MLVQEKKKIWSFSQAIAIIESSSAKSNITLYTVKHTNNQQGSAQTVKRMQIMIISEAQPDLKLTQFC